MREPCRDEFDRCDGSCDGLSDPFGDYDPPKFTTVKCGIPELDKLLGGGFTRPLGKTSFLVLEGFPGIGKTSLLNQIKWPASIVVADLNLGAHKANEWISMWVDGSPSDHLFIVIAHSPPSAPSGVYRDADVVLRMERIDSRSKYRKITVVKSLYCKAGESIMLDMTEALRGPTQPQPAA